MSDEEKGKVFILAEKIGLHPDAKPADIVEEIYAMYERTKQLEEALDKAVKASAGKEQTEKDLKRLQARRFVENAANNQWIDKCEVEDYIEDYVLDPVRTEKRINKLKFRELLGKRTSIDGAVTVDVDAEVEAKAAELMAAEEQFRGKPFSARNEVLKRNPDLEQKHREKHVTGVKGGEAVG